MVHLAAQSGGRVSLSCSPSRFVVKPCASEGVTSLSPRSAPDFSARLPQASLLCAREAMGEEGVVILLRLRVLCIRSNAERAWRCTALPGSRSRRWVGSCWPLFQGVQSAPGKGALRGGAGIPSVRLPTSTSSQGRARATPQATQQIPGWHHGSRRSEAGSAKHRRTQGTDVHLASCTMGTVGGHLACLCPSSRHTASSRHHRFALVHCSSR